MPGAKKGGNGGGKQVENTLGTAEEKYSGVLNNANNSIIVYSAVDGGKDFVFITFNSAAEKAEKIKRAKVLGRKVTQVFPGVVEAGLLNVFKRVWRTGEPEHFQGKIFKGRKIARWRDNYVYKLASGEIVAIYSDITKQKQAEEELHADEKIRASEEKYRGILSNANNSIIVYSAVEGGKEFVFNAFNTAAEKAEGIKEKTVLGRKVTQVFPGVVEAGLLDVFKRVWRTGEPEHFQGKIFKGRKIARWRDNYVYKLASGEVISIYRDITKEKQTEEALRTAEEKYRTIVESAADQIFMVDRSNKIISANRRMAAILGRPQMEVVGKSLSELFPKDTSSKISRNCRNVFRAGMGISTEERMYIGEREYYINTFLNPVRDARGRVVAVAGIVRDITGTKAAEDALKESEEHYKSLFNNSPVPLFEEDFSEVKKYLDRLRLKGVSDLKSHFMKHPEEVVACAKKVKILDVNLATARLFGGRMKESVLGSLAKLFVYESYKVFGEELVHLHTKKTPFKSEIATKAGGGRVINAIVEVSVAPNYESNWNRVLVSVTDITELKKAQSEIMKRNEDLERLSEAAVGMEIELVELRKGVKRLEAEKGA